MLHCLLSAELIINIDQTGLNIVPTSQWTMAPKGSKQIEITGIEDKRQITALLGCTMAGQLLPPQLIYAGRTPRCHPNVEFPSDWQITHTDNHWSNTASMLDFISGLLVPYCTKVRSQLGLAQCQPALCILDVYRPHHVEDVVNLFG
jgi:hypothetical protein